MMSAVRKMKLFGYILLFGIVGVAVLYYRLEGSYSDVYPISKYNEIVQTVQETIYPDFISISKYNDIVQTVQETIHYQVNLTLKNLIPSKKTSKSFKAPVKKKDNGTCTVHQDHILKAIDQKSADKWALQMVDAIGRQPSGLLHGQGNQLWLGSWEGCLSVEPRQTRGPGNTIFPFKPMYCKVMFNVIQHSKFFRRPVVIGMCFPDTCDTASLLPFADQLIRYTLSQNMRLKAQQIDCTPTDVPLSDDAWTVIRVCGYLGVVIVVATLYDLLIHACLNKKKKMTLKEKINGYDFCDKNRHVIYNNSPVNPFMANEKSPLYADVIQLESFNRELSHQAANDKNLEAESTGYSEERNNSDNEVVKYKPSIFGRLLLCFSVYSNCCKILDTAPKQGTLGALHGIRFLSLCWAILGHTTSMKGHPDNYNTWLAEMMKRLSFMVIANCTVAVDTFFVLSGSLVALLTLRQMKSRGGAHRFNWPLYYIHRIWRLTPTYAFVMAIYATMGGHWASGPLWNPHGNESKCRESWWLHLLYINNIVDTRVNSLCIEWSWYLANEMQYYFIAPLMLIPLYYSRLLGSILCLAIIKYSILTTYETSAHNNLFNILKADRLIHNGNATHSKRELLIAAPGVRVGAYVVGILLGYILYATNCKANIGKFLNVVGWLVAMTMLYLVVFWPYTPDGRFHFTVTDAATYTALHRVAWAVGVAWVIFACATGYGGLVNKLLSWPALVPLSRLSYCAYLVHPIIINTAVGSVRALPHWYDIDFAVRYAGYLTLSMAAAFIVSLLFEAPFLGLEKVLLGR